MIFQDPSTSLNPRQRIGQLLDAPLRLNTSLEPAEREQRINQTLRRSACCRITPTIIRTCWLPGRNARAGACADPAAESDRRR